MTNELGALVITAASIGFFHTIFGPDHYLPFIVISWARKWSTVRTLWITLLCGIGHILSSVVLGLVGISVGIAVGKLEAAEAFRGNIAAWLLIGFGLAYLLWGLRRAFRNKPHTHLHRHSPQQTHSHTHTHRDRHVHIHEDKSAVNLTPWVLFVIFIFGPCEPLIPILMYPAAKNSTAGVYLVTLVFGAVTISTMLGAVLLGRSGVSFVRLGMLERFSHAGGGAVILACGMAMQFLGL